MSDASPATPPSRLGTLTRLYRLLRSNWMSSTGTAIMILSLMAGVSIAALHTMGGQWAGPYMGLVLTLVLPIVFLIGLVMIPAGLLLYRHKLRERVATMTDRPMYLVRAVAILTLVNFAAIGTVGYAGVSWMGTVDFCGKACHAAMQPELVAYLDSPHNRVGCVDCHVAPTTAGFIQSKLNGAKQMIGFVTDSYHKPIPAPVHNLVPASLSCERCHWPEKYLGTKLMVKAHYREDEQVSGYTNVLLMRRGGTRADGEAVGIHWHVHPDAVVDYVAVDEQRMNIPWIRVERPDGTEDVFATAGIDLQAPPEGERRVMDCNDCHNRIGHDFELPGDALDRLIAVGLISRGLPFVKKHAMAALQGDYTRDGAAAGIRAYMEQAYEAYQPLDDEARQQLETTIEQVVRIWERNIYPERKVFWGSYPSMKGHDGCFRCHDGQHKNAAGDVVSNDCALCHTVLSENEENPAVLKTFGVGR